jgi:hypothetical protein
VHAGIGHRQSVKTIYLDIGQMLRRLANLFGSLLDCEQRIFVGIAEYHHNHALKQSTSAFDDVEMPQGNRIKTARVDCDHRLVSHN